MRRLPRLRPYQWLETHWVAPAYGGGVLMGLTIFFLGAATNTMAGWLYVISGITLAVLAMAAGLPPRTLQGLQVHHDPIRPVSVGEPLVITLTLTNPSRQARAWIQLQDHLPTPLGGVQTTAISALGPGHSHSWRYSFPAPRRGIYPWSQVVLRTAAPLGLFWCRRAFTAPTQVTIYPQVWPLRHCPLVDEIHLSTGLRWQRSPVVENATEGLTRALRPYRWGDPTRLIHWRTSARYGELRVRELEELTADNQVVIALDVQAPWSPEDFEAAVSAAASLYRYGLHKRLTVALWMAHTGLLRESTPVMTALAAVTPAPGGQSHPLPTYPLLWLSPQLAPGVSPQGTWLAWPSPSPQPAAPMATVPMGGDRPLAAALQARPMGQR